MVPGTIKFPGPGRTPARGSWFISMESLRLAPTESVRAESPCCRCGDDSRTWDSIASKTYCPNCLERLAHGEIPPVVEPIDRLRCAICHHQGTGRYLTYPLHSRRPIEVDLCSEH